MRELIERLEKAEAGDQDLSLAVNLALEGGEAVGKTANYTMEPFWAIRRPSANHVGGFANEPNYPVTRSLDAALALAERVLPDHDWSVGCLPVSDDADHEEHHHFGALLYSRYTKPYDALGHGATPALALCIAILRALRTTEQHSPAQQKKED